MKIIDRYRLSPISFSSARQIYEFLFACIFFLFLLVKRNLYESTRNLDLDRSKGAKLCGEIISRRKIKRKRKRKRKKKNVTVPRGRIVENRDDRS